MKYTLIAFNFNPDRIDRKYLDECFRHPEARANISDGVYVFDTRKGWTDIHRLRHFLSRLNISFVELPFEQALGGFFPQSTRDKLKAIGISDDALFNLSE